MRRRRAVNSTLPPSWLPDAEWADSLEESLLTAGFPVNVVTLGLYLAPQTAANGVTQLLAALPVQAPVTTAVEAVVQVTPPSPIQAVVSRAQHAACRRLCRGRNRKACVVHRPGLLTTDLCCLPASLWGGPSPGRHTAALVMLPRDPPSVSGWRHSSLRDHVCLPRSSRAR